MNLKIEKDEIKRQYYSSGSLIIISILGFVGILLIYYSGIFSIKDMNLLYDCISKNGAMIIFGAFFFGISLYCWIMFFLNFIVSPQKEILYLYKNEKNEMYFISKKGKKFEYNFNDKSIEENTYYLVLKTKDYIYEIIEKTNDNWIPNEKKNYWMNLYSPAGNFENIIILPVIYVMLLICTLSFFMSKGYQKIYGVVISIIPLYVIIYDLIYKIKLKQADYKEIDERKIFKSYEILQNSITIIGSIIILAIFIFIFLKMSDLTSKLIFLPFLGCGLCTFGAVTARAFNKYQLEKVFYKGYVIIFLIYWFGFISFFTVEFVKQEGNIYCSLFTLPFWIAGLLVLYKKVIKGN